MDRVLSKEGYRDIFALEGYMRLLLFNHVRGAAAIAQYLRGEWDECNAVFFNNPIDLAALRIAIALVQLELNLASEIEYCQVGAFCSPFTETPLGSIPIFGYSNIEQLRSVYESSEVVRGFISNGTNVIFNPLPGASAKEIANRIAFCRKLGCQFVTSFQDLTALFGEDISHSDKRFI